MPTPAASFAILAHNRGRERGLADAIVLTPSHNPPEDGGIKYNPPHGGPADSDVTAVIETRANEILRDGLRAVQRDALRARARAGGRAPRLRRALRRGARRGHRHAGDRGREAAHRRRSDGRRGLGFWAPIAERWGLAIEVVNDWIDPTFSFMTLDHDGKIRMDCSSPWAMAGLVGLKDRFDVAFGNDTDYDRHGIVTPSAGLMNPNHYLAVAIQLAVHAPAAVVAATRRSARPW